MDLFMGESNQGREELIVEAMGRTAFRHNQWKYIPPHDGNSYMQNVKIETGASDEPQLYDLTADPSEEINLYDTRKEVADSLSGLFDAIRYQ
jgi:arylsulfatase A-like enzyme